VDLLTTEEGLAGFAMHAFSATEAAMSIQGPDGSLA
jgi:hypothetical protein